MGTMPLGRFVRDGAEPVMEHDDVSLVADTKAEALRRAEARIGSVAPGRALTVQQQIALCCRFLAREDHAISLAGQITVRDEQPGRFWTTSMHAGFANATAGSILLIDADMRVIAGSGVPNPAIRFHMWVYDRRPELRAIVHTHPPHASALGMIQEPLVVAHMDTAMFYEDCAFLSEWPGVPLANEEGEIISEALGGLNSILLAHHGLLTTGESLQAAVYLAVMLERACRMQILAGGAARIRPIDPVRAREAYRFLTKKALVAATVDYWTGIMQREAAEALD